MRRSRLPFFVIVGAAIVIVVAVRVVWPNVRSDAVHIQLVYSSEKQSWIDAVTPTFNTAIHRTQSGRPIVVDTQALDSGESMNAILQGTEQPTLWSPSSQAWIGLINTGWTQAHGKALIAETCKPVVNSPLVIMMWKADAQKLGWPTTPIGWADILTLASAPNSTFRFAHTRADDSDSGLEAVISMTYAATHKQGNLSLSDVDNASTAQFMHALESSVVAYGDNTALLSSEMLAQGASFVTAAVGYESTVVASYSSGSDSPLVAIYPKEGTPMSDHPACILDASWVTDEQKDAANVYRDYLLSVTAQQQALKFGLRPAAPTPAINSPIDTSHGVDPTLPLATLPMPDVTTLRAILDTWKAQKRQVNLTLLTDVSGNMLDNPDKFPAVQQAITALIDQLDAGATVSLIPFDEQTHSITTNQPVGPNRKSLENKVKQLVVGNGTNLYDALDSVLKTTQTDPQRINAVVLLAGIGDTGSKRTLNDVLADLNKTPIAVYTIGYGAESDDNTLRRIASAGHGLFFHADAITVQQVCQQIATLF